MIMHCPNYDHLLSTPMGVDYVVIGFDMEVVVVVVALLFYVHD